MAAQQYDTYDYVIVGAGVAAASAVEGIRDRDTDGSVLVLGAETDGPVYRPDLSKTLWLESDKKLSDSELPVADARLQTDTPVVAIDPGAATVQVRSGERIAYRRLLLATGAAPRTLDLPDSDRVVYYRSAGDYRRLRSLVHEDTSVVVVGGGYIGAEIAAALTGQGADVTMVLDGELIQQALFPRSIAERVTRDFTDHGVRLVTGQRVDGGELAGDRIEVTTDGGQRLSADVVVVGVGVQPRDGLASASKQITVHDGIVVDEWLRTSADHVYAAGDVASYPDALLGRRRVEHVDNAESMGRVAGRNMAGADEKYEHTPIFWSDLFDNGYEAIGVLDSALDTVEQWNGDKTAAVVYYRDGAVVRGVLLWNVWDSTDKARELIARSQTTRLTDEELRAAIPTE